ncbi:MAG: zinc ribbon domain-containing protein, partial [Aggregatilineales bacterium]
CIINKPDNLQDELYAKMRVSWNNVQKEGYYRCLSGERGYHKCDQKGVPHSQIDEDILHLLSNLTIPVDKRQQIEQAVQNRIQESRVHERIEEAKKIIQKIDNPHDRGYIVSERDSIAKIRQVQLEFDSMQPERKNVALEATDLLDNFARHWAMCETFDNTDEMRQHLLKKLVKRVYMYDRAIVGIMLYGEYLFQTRYHTRVFREIESKIVI